MANKLYEESSISAIAEAIRGKNFENTTYTVAEMSTAISNIDTGFTIQKITQDNYDALTEYTTNCFYVVERSSS